MGGESFLWLGRDRKVISRIFEEELNPCELEGASVKRRRKGSNR